MVIDLCVRFVGNCCSCATMHQLVELEMAPARAASALEVGICFGVWLASALVVGICSGLRRFHEEIVAIVGVACGFSIRRHRRFFAEVLISKNLPSSVRQREIEPML